MKGKLFDASALINIMIRKGSEALKVLSGQSILDLTIYEVGNSIWRLSYIEKKISNDQACAFLDSFLLLLQRMKIININGMEKSVKEFSMENGLTFYDASYLVVSKTHDLILVTDDKTLSKVALKHTKVESSDL
ncbi:MAG: type II toxin-antitoxin system VapC family toxin [Nitrososphaerales archaeon]